MEESLFPDDVSMGTVICTVTDPIQIPRVEIPAEESNPGATLNDWGSNAGPETGALALSHHPTGCSMFYGQSTVKTNCKSTSEVSNLRLC